MVKEKEKKFIFLAVMILVLIIICFYVIRYNNLNNNLTNSSNQTQSVLDKGNVTDINIDIDESLWEELKANATDEEYYQANITINGEIFYNVGVRAKGNSSLTSIAQDDTTDRYSLKIKFDKYVDGQTYHGLEKIALNNNYQDSTYMKEYLSYEIYESLGVPTPEYTYSNITINGEAWGLYLAIEDIDERYIEKYYGSVDGNLYKPETMDMNGDMGQKNEGMIQPNFQGNENGEQGNVPTDMPQVIPEGMEGNIPTDMPQGMPEGMEGNVPTDMPQGMPEGMEGNVPTDMPQNMPQGMGGNAPNGMPGVNNGGADLVYVDDNIESYSTITESAEFKATTEEDFKTVVDMIKNLNNGENLEQCLNVEEILKYFAVNTFLVNLDSYSGGMYHNYYLYERDGVFEMLPWDLNMSFAGYGITSESEAVNFPIDSPVLGDLEDAPLIGKLLEVDSYKELYHSYLNTLIENYINNDGLVNLVDKVDSMINEYVKSDVTAFYTYDEYESSLPELKSFIQNRGVSIIAQLNGEQPSSEYGDIEATFTLSALGGHGAGGKGGPGKQEMNNFNNGEGIPEFPGNMDGVNMPQPPEGMDENNIPQFPEGMNENSVPQLPSGTE